MDISPKSLSTLLRHSLSLSLSKPLFETCAVCTTDMLHDAEALCDSAYQTPDLLVPSLYDSLMLTCKRGVFSAVAGRAADPPRPQGCAEGEISC
jgi:hypothetical protein